MKEFLRSPKKTTILGLVGSILMLITTIFSQYTASIATLVCNIFIIGLIFYFSTVLLRMYRRIGNIKAANILLLASFIICVLLIFVDGVDEITPLLPNIIFFGTISLYLYTIFFGNIKFINNKIFAIVVVVYSIYQMVVVGIYFLSYLDIHLILYSIKFLGYMAIVPYFYNYYELLKED